MKRVKLDMAKKQNITSTSNTEQVGVNAVEAAFLAMKWIFRRQLEADFGVDAQVEVVEAGQPSGKLFGVQIKSGPSYFHRRGDDYVYYGEQRHLEYWERHSLPILLVLYNPENDMMLWQRIERHLVTESLNGRWSIEIPATQTLTVDSTFSLLRRFPSSDPESERRNRLALDVELMRQVRDASAAYVLIDEWQNKSLNFRGATIALEEYDADPIHDVSFLASTSNPSRVFDWFFPWLEFKYGDIPEEDGSGEILTHVFEVTLNQLGKTFLTLEDYYRDGVPLNSPVFAEEPTGLVDEDGYANYKRNKAFEDDWEEEFRSRGDKTLKE